MPPSSQRERKIMRGLYAELLLVFGLLCTRTTVGFDLNKLNSEVRCMEEERQALLKLKQGLQDDYHLLSSWGSHEKDCCKWKGVVCSNLTGHIVKLDLRQSNYSKSLEFLSGEISSSILGLQHLTYLNLSMNNFSILPEFIGSFAKLQYLNLSYNPLSGTIPRQLGNLSSLISLDLHWNFGLIEGHNLDWLLHLSSLKHLDMSGVNFSKVANWPDKVNMLPSLLDLSLSDCVLSMPISFILSNINSSSQLSIIDLSINNLNSSVFSWLFKYINSLLVLYLNDNTLKGSIPKAFGDTELHNLQVLDLSNYSIS
jgi:EIX receptor 1/2